MWTLRLTIAICVALQLCLLTACPAALGVGPALEGGPVSGLTLPAGSTITATNPDQANWGVSFDNTSGEDAVFAYMSAQLLAKGFKEDLSFRDSPGSAHMRGFSSSDGRWNVMLTGGSGSSYNFYFAPGRN